MVHRRNIRDVQQAGEPSVAALCVREQGFSACLLQAVVNFSQLAESDAHGEEAQRRERLDAALIAAIVCRIWQDRNRIGPPVRHQPPRFSNITETEAWHDLRFRAEERKLLCPKPLRALRVPRRVALRNGSTFHGATSLRLLLRRMRKALLCL